MALMGLSILDEIKPHSPHLGEEVVCVRLPHGEVHKSMDTVTRDANDPANGHPSLCPLCHHLLCERLYHPQPLLLPIRSQY
jgi:hypothetical protein